MLRLHTYHPFEVLSSLCTLESMPTKSIFAANIAEEKADRGTTNQWTGERADKKASMCVGDKNPPTIGKPQIARFYHQVFKNPQKTKSIQPKRGRS